MYAENFSPTWPEELRLRKIVGLFHLTQSEEERRLLADDYAATVGRLIESGMWPEMPPIEDFLPEEWMPKEFYDYWLSDEQQSAGTKTVYPFYASLTWMDETRLATLARRFRSTRSDEERQVIAKDYAATVQRLVESGHWEQGPNFDEMLPDEWMPKAFYDYWLGPDHNHQ